jgi:ribosomal protein S17E
MKRVLIVFPFSHQFSFVEGKCMFLRDHGVDVDAFLIDFSKIKFYSFSKGAKPFVVSLLCFFFNFLKNIPGFYHIGLNKLIPQTIFKAIINRYDIIEFSGVYSENRLKMAEYAKSKGKKVNVAIWGTDFYGISDYENDWHENLFSIADIITIGSRKMENDVNAAYPQFSNKVFLKIDGLKQLEVLKDILDGKIDKDLSFLDERASNKIVLTIGYTGRTWQQHFYVLDALSKLEETQKNKLFLIMPMTYDANPEYMSYIESRLARLGIPFQILKKRLSLIQNLSMRTVSDIAVCIQNTDGLAASVREHIMAGSVFVGGDWLPYKLFQDEGMYIRLTSVDGLFYNLNEVI